MTISGLSPITSWSDISNDVVDRFRTIFRAANWRLTETLQNVPSIRETTLDDTLIQALLPHSAPTRLGSGAVARMDVHNIGGLRRMTSWEIGDIAILVFLARRSSIIGRKLGILKAKRLYPSSGNIDEIDSVGFRDGMNALLRPEESPTSMLLRRTFNFNNESVYGALRSGSRQQTAIEKFEQDFEKSVYYLFYNPPRLPLTIDYPLECYSSVRREPKLGARVLPMQIVHDVLRGLPQGRAPSVREVNGSSSSNGGWRLEEWVADLLLTCKEGRRYHTPDETAIRMMLERRSGPIGAAIAIHIQLPEA
jgi:hypothetical protein